jgi:hypothetical protein
MGSTWLALPGRSWPSTQLLARLGLPLLLLLGLVVLVVLLALQLDPAAFSASCSPAASGTHSVVLNVNVVLLR